MEKNKNSNNSQGNSKKLNYIIYPLLGVLAAGILFYNRSACKPGAEKSRPAQSTSVRSSIEVETEKPSELEEMLNQAQITEKLNNALEAAGLTGRKYDLRFNKDGKKFLFRYGIEEGTIWEVGLNGEGLRKITEIGESDNRDNGDCVLPYYNPNGNIGFTYRTSEGVVARHQICEVPGTGGPREPKEFTKVSKLEKEEFWKDIFCQNFTPRGTKISEILTGKPRIYINDKLVENSIGTRSELNAEETEMLIYIPTYEPGLGKPGIYVQRIKDENGNLKPEKPRLIEGTEKFQNPIYLPGYNERFILASFGGDRDGGYALIDKEKWERGEQGYVIDRELGYNPGNYTLHGDSLLGSSYKKLSVLSAKKTFSKTLGNLETRVNGVEK